MPYDITDAKHDIETLTNELLWQREKLKEAGIIEEENDVDRKEENNTNRN